MTQHIVLTPLKQRDAVYADAVQTSQGEVFLTAASSLFITAARLKNLSQEIDPIQLQQQLIQQIQQFEFQLQQKNIRTEQILIAKYFICALLDDLIEHDWLGGEGFWRAYALTFYFFQESAVDEKIFTVMSRLQQEPSTNIALIEFAYMILIYGYQGRYRREAQGYFRLLEKMNELYLVLQWHYGDFRKSLFLPAGSAHKDR
ncbi:MAG: hypothetical protein K0S08_12 [Gammaproteobacteria bacterium]|jgi:type VI secretion system protein ImpK|nr:hypothetical protein [Gammaproteobacteria bacterium]